MAASPPQMLEPNSQTKDSVTPRVQDQTDPHGATPVQPAERSRFLDVLRASFYCIHATLSRIGVKEFVPLHDHPNIVCDYERLTKLEKIGQDQEFVDIDGTMTPISIKSLLDGVSHASNRHPMPTVKVFYSYAHEDEEHRNKFQTHLSRWFLAT